MRMFGRNMEAHLSKIKDGESKEDIKERKDTKKQINKIYKEDKNVFKRLAEL